MTGDISRTTEMSRWRWIARWIQRHPFAAVILFGTMLTAWAVLYERFVTLTYASLIGAPSSMGLAARIISIQYDWIYVHGFDTVLTGCVIAGLCIAFAGLIPALIAMQE
jgi:hypothetical protein